MTHICKFFVSNVLSDSDMVRLESTRLSTTTNIMCQMQGDSPGDSPGKYCE